MSGESGYVIDGVAWASLAFREKRLVDSEFLLSKASALLHDADYFSAHQVIRANNFCAAEQKPTKDNVEEATATMLKIEKEKGIKGFITAREK